MRAICMGSDGPWSIARMAGSHGGLQRYAVVGGNCGTSAYTLQSMRLIPFVFALLVLSPAPLAASVQDADGCATLEAQSTEVVGLRDHDAAEGLRLGQELLAAWRDTGEECASG